jgi:hypothetical protein
VKLAGEKRRTRGKTCPSATLSTTNPTRTDPGSNPGFRGGRPAANRLSHGTAKRGLRTEIMKSKLDHLCSQAVDTKPRDLCHRKEARLFISDSCYDMPSELR